MTERRAPGELEADPVGAQDGLADQERGEAGDGADHEGDGTEHGGFGGDDRMSLRGGDEGGADHPGGVLAGDDQHAEDADGQLGEDHPARLVETGSKRSRAGPVCEAALMAAEPIMAIVDATELQ